MADNLGVLTPLNETPSRDIFADASHHPQQITVTVLSGQGVLKRGTLLAKVTSSGKYVKWDNDPNTPPTDGSQTLVGVLATDIDATSEDKKAPLYITGTYNASALTATITVATGVYNNLGTINIVKEY